MQGSDNGTPTQKDEPQAANPPNGASIDYYLKTAATGPVTIEIQDAAARASRLFTSDRGVGAGVRRGGGWTRRARSVAAAAAASRTRRRCGVRRPSRSRTQRRHAPRYLGAGGGGGAVVADAASVAAPPAGPFTAKLTVNGQTYTQTFDVKPDPRMK